MKRLLAVLFLVATTAAAQVPTQRIAQDAKVIDRVAEASMRDLPGGLLKRIVNEDLDLLRGKRADGSYEFATYERLETGRVEEDFSIQGRKDDQLQKLEIRGAWVYRLTIGSPSRRMLLTKNRRVWIDRVELEYIAQGSPGTKTHVVKVGDWLDPRDVKPIEFPEVARQATARVFARGDAESGYGNVVLTLIQAKIVDNADSPYKDAVASAKAIIRAIDNGEIPSIRAMATRLHDALASSATTAESTIAVVAPREDPNIYSELQAIEDLLTGNDAERREGLDRLHQLVRRLRQR